MKISNASKKVLASALSAAMVVAFAPAVALADVCSHDKVTVKFDTTGFNVKAGSSAIASELEAGSSLVTVGADKITIAGSVFANHDYVTSDNEAVTGWYIDADNDGKYNDGVDVTVNTSGSATSLNNAAGYINDGATVTVRPYYSAAAGDVTFTATDVTAAQAWSANGTAFAGVTANVKEGIYNVSLKKNGTELLSYARNVTTGTTGEAVNIAFAASEDGKDGIKKADWGAGEYTLTYTNAKDMKVAGELKLTVVEATLGGVFSGDVTNVKVLAVAGTEWSTALTAANIKRATEDGKSEHGLESYAVDGADVVKWGVTNSDEVEKSATYGWVGSSKVKAGQAKLDAVYKHAAKAVLGYNEYKGYVGAIYAEVIPGSEYGVGESFAEDAKYTYELGGAASNTVESVGYDEGELLYTFGTGATTAGKYTLKVTVTENADSPATKKITEVSAADLQLTAVTFDAGENGKLTDSDDKTAVVVNDGKLTAYDLKNGASVTPNSSDYDFCGWSLDGSKTVTVNDAIAADAASVTLKAVYHDVKVQKYAPAYSYADGKLTLSTDKGDGYKVFYTVGNESSASNITTEYTGPVAVSKDTVISAVVKKDNGSGTYTADSGAKVVVISKADGSSVKSWADTVLNVKASDSTSTAPKYYKDALTTAAADAKAAIEAKGFLSDEDAYAAELEQKKAVVAKIAECEKAQIDAYLAGVADKDGNVKKATEAQAADAKKAVEQVISDLDIATGSDKTVATAGKYGSTPAKINGGTYENTKSDNVLTESAAKDFVAAITEAAADLAAGATKYAKADVDAAAAVTSQLEAAKDAAAAKAAIEAYGALTDTQKALVSADALKAAHAIVDAQTVIDEQDQAAVNYCNSVKKKTVKVAKKTKKTKKKASVSWKKQVSESGNAVTYSKVSGAAKVTVSANGKATLKKGVKKGTYKAKVKVTCGNATRTVTAKFIVK